MDREDTHRAHISILPFAHGRQDDVYITPTPPEKIVAAALPQVGLEDLLNFRAENQVLKRVAKIIESSDVIGVNRVF